MFFLMGGGRFGVCRKLSRRALSVCPWRRASTMGVCGDEWLVVKGKKKKIPRKKGNPRQDVKEARTMTVFLVGVQRRKGRSMDETKPEGVGRLAYIKSVWKLILCPKAERDRHNHNRELGV